MEIEIRKGNLIFDCTNDKVFFQINSKYVYTEPGENVEIGNVMALTENKGEYNVVTLERDFSDVYNLTYKNEDMLKTLNKASTPYKVYLTNNGEISNKIVMDFDLE